MKKIKELKLEELSVKQKIGMAFTAFINGNNRTKEDDEFVLNLIRNHSLGAVWVQQSNYKPQEIIDMIREVANYPILIVTDAESGMGDYVIGKHNALGCTDNEEQAYVFGKGVGVTARKMGYNIVCNPLLDLSTTGSVRSLGSDKERVARLAAAEARGMKDAGILTLGKHYPGGNNPNQIDSHMAESISDNTKEELLEYSLYPYQYLMDQGLLDGIMVGHKKFVNIDPEFPASLSSKMIEIIREMGFDGIAMTDALCMMSILSKYGEVECKGLALVAGIDAVLPYHKNQFSYEALCTCYEQGMIPDERIDEAARRILEAQHKSLEPPKYTEVTEEEKKIFQAINKDGIYAKTDEGLLPSLPRDGKYYFALMIRNENEIKEGTVAVDTFSNGWHYPSEITKKLEELFPNSKVVPFYQFPTQSQNCRILSDSIYYDETIFITFTEALAYTGKEHLTRRVVTLIEAMQMTDRISTIVHFGNPFVLEELPHTSRYILGGPSANSVNAALDVLAGKYPAKGHLTYDVTLP